MRFAVFLLAALAQAQIAPPAFEVASFKPTEHGKGPDGWGYSDQKITSPGTFGAVNSSLEELLLWAYNVKEYQIAGPEWLSAPDAPAYDITAKFPPDTPRKDVRIMLQTLLAERLKVAVHKENRTLTGYKLVVARNGPANLHPAEGRSTETMSAGGRVTAKHVSVAEWAYQLSRNLERPVIDATGIAGYFDFKLNYEPKLDQETDTRPSLFTALQEQLGLKLESAKVPVEMVVVDHAERIPAAN
jgi:uncharacterized protein (TIGR03435 family)